MVLQHETSVYGTREQVGGLLIVQYVTFNDENQRRSLKTQLKGLGGLEGENRLKSANSGIRGHPYLMAASTNTGFSKSNELSPSAFWISNAQMRFMRKLYTAASPRCCPGHCLGQV